MSILITGASGSVGQALAQKLRERGEPSICTDIDTLDVTDRAQVAYWIGKTDPRVIFHLAGAKHAPEGEVNPAEVGSVNFTGTLNVLEFARPGSIVLASTGKAANPETAYGASKLLAERAVLNAGGKVVRFYNVRETSGNVFRLWEALPENYPIRWTDCERYFISLDQAVDLLIRAADLPSGRYAVDPGLPRHMHEIALGLYPGRVLEEMEPRRGDRIREPLCGTSETVTRDYDGLLTIRSRHDA